MADLDAIMAEHARCDDDPGGAAYCEGCGDWDWPCETYRLADRALQLIDKLRSVRSFAEMGAIGAHARGQFEFERRWLDLLHLLDQPGDDVAAGSPCSVCGGPRCLQADEEDPKLTDDDLPGMWSHTDFEGGPPDEVRGPDWRPTCIGGFTDSPAHRRDCPVHRGQPAPEEREVVDLAAALRASVEAAGRRREQATRDRQGKQ